jgi:hypothetical protein
MGLKRNIKRCVKDFNKKRFLTQRSYAAIKSKLASPAVMGGSFLSGIVAGFLIPKHKKISVDKKPVTTHTLQTPQFSNYLKRQLFEGLSMLLIMPGMRTVMEKLRLF